VDLAQCALNPLLCALQQATGTDPSGLYTGFVHSQGISTSSHSTYNGGLWSGAVLQMAAGGLLGAGAAADAGTAAGKEITTYYPSNRGFFDEPTSQVLKTGTRIDRYGGEGGTFVSPEGTPEPMRALPPGATTRPYNVYEVVNPVEVRAGTVSPWFGQLGLGTQYELPDSVGNLIQNGYLKLAEDGG
jgi:hypothetical protein